MIRTTNIRRILDRIMRHPMLRDVPFEAAVEHTVDDIYPITLECYVSNFTEMMVDAFN